MAGKFLKSSSKLASLVPSFAQMLFLKILQPTWWRENLWYVILVEVSIRWRL